MYQAYWGLGESPFRNVLDPNFFYQSPTHEEALARLQFLVLEKRRLGLISGPSGSGKSFLLKIFAAQIRQAAQPVAKLSLLAVEPAEMLWRVLSGWGCSLDQTSSLSALWRKLSDRLIEYRYQQLAAIALFDDVDRAGPETLQCIERLANYDRSPEARLSVVLAGREISEAVLGDRLIDMAELRVDLEPWEPADTEHCVTSLLAQAGRRSPIFAKPAVERLHELSHGIPRQVSQLADLSLMAGAGQRLQQIDVDVVENVFQELCRHS